MNEKKFSLKISFISLFAAIGVMYIHAIDTPSYNVMLPGGKMMAFIENWIGGALFGHISVSLFFFISAYLFFNNIVYLKDWVKKIKRRVGTLLIPYVFWAFFGYMVFVIINNIPFLADGVNTKTSFSLKELYNIFVLLRYSHHLWYIQNLALYFVISFFLVRLRNKFISIGIFFVLFMLCIFDVELGFFMTTRFLAFYGGFLVQRFFSSLVYYKNKGLSIVACIVLVLVSCLLTSWRLPMLDKAWYIISPVLFWMAFDLIDFERLEAKCAFSRLKKHSFYIYCSHGIIIECVKQVFVFLGTAPIVMCCSYFLSPIITIVVIFVGMFIMKAISPRFVSLITGSRSC